MYTLFIRYFFVCLCAYYSYLQIIKINYSRKYVVIQLSFFPITILICTLHNFNAIYRIIGMLVLSLILLTSLTKTPLYVSLISSLISFGLSYVALSLSGTLVCFVYLYIYKTADLIPYSHTYFPTGILQSIFVFTIFQFNRFKSGLNYIIKERNVFRGIIISILLIILFILISCGIEHPISVQLLLLIFILSLSLLIIFYWRYRITQTYREKLRIANEKSLEDELHNQRERIADLEADNARLSQIVHKDNKIILAMLTAVTEHLENTIGSTPEELTIQGMELSAQLQDMAKERQGILNTQTGQINILPKSGLHTVDGMLSFMETRAKEAEITYKLQIEENIKEIASNAIPEADLLHLLADLIDNAIIATKHANDKHEILIHLGTLQNHFLLEISDSGIPFSLDTYQSFGNEPHTTHGSDGGSGIGLMDIWKLKKKYKASLHIYEYEEGEGIYTKKLTFIFDCKNHFFLQTPRYKEATYALTRGDLYIFPNKAE